MSKVADLVALVFNPLFILGMTRMYVIFDSTRKYEAKFYELISYPMLHIPLLCCIFSLASAALSHETNKRFVSANPQTRANSFLGMLTFASAACLMLMFYFVVDFKQVFWWFRSYGLLCLVNAIWNYLAVSSQTRFRYVASNIFLFVVIAAVTTLFQSTLVIYLLFAGISIVKFWQRSQPREFQLQAV